MLIQGLKSHTSLGLGSGFGKGLGLWHELSGNWLGLGLGLEYGCKTGPREKQTSCHMTAHRRVN